MNTKVICTQCFFVGAPKASPFRIISDFILAFFSGGTVSVLGASERCPECGKESVVSLDSEEGKEAFKKLKEEKAS